MQPPSEPPKSHIWQRHPGPVAGLVIVGLFVVGLTVLIAWHGYGLTEPQANDFLSATLTVTVGLLAGVFFVAQLAISSLARHPADPRLGDREGWVLVFLLDIGALSLALLFAAAGLVGAWSATSAVAAVAFSWLAGMFLIAFGIFFFFGRAPPGAS